MKNNINLLKISSSILLYLIIYLSISFTTTYIGDLLSLDTTRAYAVGSIISCIILLFIPIDKGVRGIDIIKDDIAKKVFSLSFLYDVVFIISSAILLNVIFAFVSLEDVAYEEVAKTIYNMGFVERVAFVALFAPITEEIVFRLMILNKIRYEYGSKVSIVLSAFLFGLIHMNLTQFIYAFIIGMMIANIYCKYDNILCAILTHATVNFVIIILENSVELFTIVFFIAVAVLAVILLNKISGYIRR